MNPTNAQTAALQSDSPLTFVIAGAGAGKTKTLVWRVIHLIEELDVEPSHIVAITFTNAGAREMEKRLSALGIRIGYIGTLHSYMLRLLRAHASMVGYKPMINVLDEEESEAFRVKVESDLKYNGTKTALDAALALGPPSQSERLSKERLVAAHYYKQLRSANLMTFDSILIYGLMVVRGLRDKVARSTHHILIDEVQDSSDLDFNIYGALVGERFFVGDPDQAIYSFRGGDVSHCLKLANIAKMFTLEDNFRCGSLICEAAQRLIEHNRNRYPKATRSATGFPGAVVLRSYSDPSIEAAGIANSIATTDTCRTEIAVLVRTNDLVQEYANHLRAVGIQVAERVFKERPADFGKARRLLAFLNNPDDDYVAEQWLHAHVEAHQVTHIKAAAAAAFKTINQFHFKITRPSSLGDIGKHLDTVLSLESKLLLEKLATDLPDDADIADLILAIGSQEVGEEVGSGVTVTTIHGAKGREWGTVFLPAFEQETIPGVRKSMDIEEERRLAYVAFTRAKQSLNISLSRVRVPKFGRPVPTVVSPSQFIAEAGL